MAVGVVEAVKVDRSMSGLVLPKSSRTGQLLLIDPCLLGI